ncbi:flagellar assembly factor FliW [Blastococcus colisei]|uniref:Flagellar assembly factor FliW n=1 Tax=Blastococcus colisei TaxID=1564162 RepID=A0A543P051_9ACTN|nr:flagellar assembly protein FliW [Blastococcus colisei]TQN37476.1 flagellar assembly factor FliW [Blastococcus colisei]
MTPSRAVLAERRSVPGRAAAPAAAVPAVQALHLVEPLPGFPGHSDYVLVAAEDGGRLFWLQSVAPDGPRFLAIPARAYFPDYAPTLPAAVHVELGLAAPAEARFYCLVTVPDGDVGAATANLRAPVVVNQESHLARQVVLLDGAHPIRGPLRR